MAIGRGLNRRMATGGSAARNAKQGRCGGSPKRDGSGGGRGNQGTERQPSGAKSTETFLSWNRDYAPKRK